MRTLEMVFNELALATDDALPSEDVVAAVVSETAEVAL